MPKRWSPRQRAESRKLLLESRKSQPQFQAPALPTPSASEEAFRFYYDYYQVPFGWLHTQLPSSFDDAAVPPEARSSFWHLVPDGNYSPDEGRDLVLAYANALERQLADELRSHSLAYWLHVYRRTAPEPAGRSRSGTTVYLVRRTLESAFQKYAALTPQGDIGWSNEVGTEEIFPSLPEKYQMLDFLERVKSGPPQQVLIGFGLNNLVQLYRCEKLAYELWRCGSTLRLMGKGAGLVVNHFHRECFYDNRSNELDRLVVSYDSRESPAVASATGTVFTHTNSDTSRIFVARYNLTRSPATRYNEIFAHHAVKFSSDFFFNFDWVPFDLGGFLESHAIFSKPFKKKHGFGYEDVLLVAGCISFAVAGNWIESLSHMYSAFQRGCVSSTPWSVIRSKIFEFLPSIAEELHLPVPSDDEIDRAIGYLTLTEEKRAQISLLTGGPNYLFLPTGDDRAIIDFAWLADNLHYLFFGLPLGKAHAKGVLLEKLVTSAGSSLPNAECRGLDHQARQVDGAFGRGRVLVIAECKSTARSIAVDRGDRAALEFRRQKFEKALCEVDDKARWLAGHPFGANYDVRSYGMILPVVVTPFPEFIPSLELRYWINSAIPRVLTPHELQELLALEDLELIANKCSATVYLPKVLET